MNATIPRPTVLLVDDDEGLLRLMERTLRREGIQAASCASGRAALEWLRGNRADLLLLDLKLQDLSGQELIQRLDSGQRRIPFVVITGQGDERVAVQMMKSGALDYLVKDAEFLELLPAVVARVLGQLDQQKRLLQAEGDLRREHALTDAILETSGALVIVLDPEGKVVRFNRACAEISGYTAEEMLGQPIWQTLLASEEAQGVRAVFQRLAAGEGFNQFENDWVAKDGTRRRIAWSNTSLKGPDGSVEFVIGTGIDITERKRLEREILEVSSNEQRRIGQDLHDGICQQLAGIEFLSQVLEQDLTRRELKAAAQAGKIGAHVRDLIEQTRSLARGLVPVELEAAGLMAALEELAAQTGEIYGVSCEFQCPNPVLVRNNAMAVHLYRIAQEAISNALKHGKASKVLVRLDNQEEKGFLSIRDNGAGLPPSGAEGTGMGLRIMQYRAGMIGGRLEIQRRGKRGTEIHCYFRLDA